MRSGNVNLKAVRGLFLLSLFGAVCGTTVLRQIPSDFLKPLVVVMLILITIYTIFRKNWGERSTFRQFSPKTAVLMGCAAFGLGFYDGFFGNAKVLNFGSNVASLITFMVLGAINYGIDIPMGIAMVCGSLLGSRMAIRKGSAYTRPLFIIVCVLLIGKQIWDVL